MSLAAILKVIETSNESGADLLALIFIADYADDDGLGARPSHAALAAKLRLKTRDGGKKAISRLVNKGRIIKHEGAGEKSPTGSNKNLYDIIFEDGSNLSAIESRCELFNTPMPSSLSFVPYDRQARYKSFLKGGTPVTPLGHEGGTPVTPKGGTPVTPESCHVESCHDSLLLLQGKPDQKFTIPKNDKGPNLNSGSSNGPPEPEPLPESPSNPPLFNPTVVEYTELSDKLPMRVVDPEYGQIMALWESSFGWPSPQVAGEIGRLYDLIEPPRTETKFQWFEYAIQRGKEIDTHGHPHCNLIFAIIEGGKRPGLKQVGGVAAAKQARQKAEKYTQDKESKRNGKSSNGISRNSGRTTQAENEEKHRRNQEWLRDRAAKHRNQGVG